jgi:hypothetical protein
MKTYIAERRLFYSEKGADTRKGFVIRISVPYTVDEKSLGYVAGDGFSACDVDIDGLDEEHTTVYGTDSVQALNLATNLEPYLNRLQKKYDLYWSDGEPYFEE